MASGENEIRSVWGIIATVVIIVAVFLVVFTSVVDWGKTAPDQINDIKTQTEQLSY